MIVLEKTHAVRKSGIENQGISFGIKKDGLAHIFNVLRNQLYSNKILAVIREYSCNAYDAHVEVGNSEKFVVTCPTLENPNFIVRDFGAGLSPSGIAEVYAYYGESTKRQSNELIGQLGLGSKSGFAYGDNFVIKSYFDGTLYTYNAFLDESMIGQILLMSEEQTSENNGVEIIIPVKLKDIFSFKENIANFFKYFKNKPVVKNIEKEFLDSHWRTNDQVLFGDKWEFNKSKNSWDKTPSLMVVGNVAYPLDGNSVDSLPSIFHTEFVVYFEIGELEVSASRESLQFSPKTQNAIKKRFKGILEEITKTLSDKITNAKNLFEAKSIYNSLTSSTGEFYRFKSFFQNVTWKNRAINDHKITCTNKTAKGVKLYEIVKSGRSERIICRAVENKIILCDTWSRLYVDDTRHKFMSRLAHYVFEQCNSNNGIHKIYVLEFQNDSFKKDYLTETFIEEGDLPYVSSEKVKKIEYPKNSDGSSVIKDSKHISSEFKLDLSFDANWCKVKSNQFIQTNFDLDAGGVYIHINRFHCKSYFNPSDVECIIDASKFIKLFRCSMSNFQIDFPTELACFKEDTAKKIYKNPKWKSLKTYLEDYIRLNWVNGESQKIVNYIELQEFLHGHSSITHYLSKINNIPIITKFTNLIDSFKIHNDMIVSDSFISLFKNTGLLSVVTAKLQPTHNLNNELNKIKERYKIFEALDIYMKDRGPAIVEKYLLLEEKFLTSSVSQQ